MDIPLFVGVLGLVVVFVTSSGTAIYRFLNKGKGHESHLTGLETRQTLERINEALQKVVDKEVAIKDIDYDSLTNLVEVLKDVSAVGYDSTYDTLAQVIKNEAKVFETPRPDFVEGLLVWISEVTVLSLSIPDLSEREKGTVLSHQWDAQKVEALKKLELIQYYTNIEVNKKLDTRKSTRLGELSS